MTTLQCLRGISWRGFSVGSSAGSSRCASSYEGLLEPAGCDADGVCSRLSCCFACARFCCFRFLGRTSFRAAIRARSSCICGRRAARVSKRRRSFATWWSRIFARLFLPSQIDNILDNIGLPYSTLNTQHATSGLIGPGDADILVSLKEDHRPTAEYVSALRQSLPRDFPGVIFYFLPSDIVTQILNFGLPAPIDVQFEGSDIAAIRGRLRIR